MMTGLQAFQSVSAAAVSCSNASPDATPTTCCVRLAALAARSRLRRRLGHPRRLSGRKAAPRSCIDSGRRGGRLVSVRARATSPVAASRMSRASCAFIPRFSWGRPLRRSTGRPCSRRFVTVSISSRSRGYFSIPADISHAISTRQDGYWVAPAPAASAWRLRGTGWGSPKGSRPHSRRCSYSDCLSGPHSATSGSRMSRYQRV